MASRTTLVDLASTAGVSVATVSKVLNGRPGVGAAKRDEILRLARESGYQPRGQTTRKPARLIDLVMRGIDNPWATCVLVGAESEAARAGVGLVVSVTHGRDLGNAQWIDRLAHRHSDGLVLVVSRLTEGVDAQLARLRIPYVLVDPLSSAPPNVPVVGATNAEGGRSAVDHLVELGHRRIAIIAGTRQLACAQQRLDGYRAGLARAGIPVDERYVQFGNFEVSGGYKAAMDLLALPEPPTAIFAGSDLQACGVYRAARERGLRVPDDLSVVGFDDSPLADWLIPGLTTVRQPLEDMARQATRILLAMTEKTAPVTPRLQLGTTLIVRESTAPPRPA
ncbi:MAG: LacI family DNA-binding transcriptional regulator [Propionibacteriaceae bacterium]|jgi:DNA-binding LacI/PurR family transcriptional regulator|nr:LacI family DNA-binding transcriptional regulator [Propionibacteriaceae bacterium]